MGKQSEPAPVTTGLANIYHTSRTEYASASLGARAVLATSLGGLAFEWGTGNEALLGMAAGSVHEITQNPVATGLATGAVSFAEQGTFGALMAATIYQFPKVAESVRTMTTSAAAPRVSSGTSRFLEAFAFGSAVCLAKENAVNARSLKQNVGHMLGSSAMIGASVALLSSGASSLLALGSRHGFETQAETTVDILTNPLTYVGLLAASYSVNRVKRLVRSRREARRSALEIDRPESMAASTTVPNKLVIANYQSYRALCDEQDGLMRSGIRDARLYREAVGDSDTVFATVQGIRLPIISSRDSFHIEGQTQTSTLGRNALVSRSLIPHELRQGLIATERIEFGEEQVMRIIAPRLQDPKLRISDVPRLFEDVIEGDLLDGHGEAQFTVFTTYDVGACKDMRGNCPEAITTHAGHTVTTDKEEILANLESLVELHEKVFRQQEARIGYYDGLVGNLIQELLTRDDFIGAAAFDKDTGKPFMFALFASHLSAVERLPWLNQGKINEMIRSLSDDENPAVAMPVIIASKFNGRGVFSETVYLAMHEILHRTQVKLILPVVYNANLQSVLYTPRIINTSAERQGAILKTATIEATVLTKESSD